MHDIQLPPSSNKNSQENPIKDTSGNSDDQHSASSYNKKEDNQNTDTILKYLHNLTDSQEK